MKKAPQRRLFIRRFTFPSAPLFFLIQTPERPKAFRGSGGNLQSGKLIRSETSKSRGPGLDGMGSETAHVEGVLCFTGYPSVSRPWGKQSRRPDAPDLPCVGEAYAGAVRGSPPGLGALLKSHATLRMEGKSASITVIPCWSATTSLTCLRGHWSTRALIFFTQLRFVKDGEKSCWETY